jgi:hypothetical protein
MNKKIEDDENHLGDLEPFCMALNAMGEQKLAIQVLDAFAKKSFNFKQFDNLSKCYFKLKDYQKSIKYGEDAIAQILHLDNLQLYITRFNMINVYNHANYPEKAMTYIACNELLAPDDVDLQLEKAYSLYLLNRKPEAEQILQGILENRKDLSQELITKIKFNLGTYFLYRDKFQQGMQYFIFEGAKMKLWNTQTIFSRNEEINLPFWQGSPDTKNLVVFAEAGIGDEIINIRFMKELKERNINAIWYEATCSARNEKNDRPGLIEVFRKNGYPVVSNLNEIDNLQDYSWTYSMHLPIYLNLEYKDLWNGSYLKSSEEFEEKWKSKLGSDSSLPKIGVRWQGSPLYDHDLHRSYPLNLLFENIKDCQASFHSLQKDEGLDQLNDFPGLIDWSQDLETLEDAFGLISNLDLVITSCTSVAHIAASMGKEVFILVPISAYYVWSHSLEQSPWYGRNVKLFRQQKPRCWKEPIRLLTQELKNRGFIRD